jgi:hypothetical protein
MVNRVCVFVTRFIVGSFDLSEPELECGSPTALAFVTVVKAHQAEENGAFCQVSSESAPPRVPLSGLVRRAGDLQYPVPDCQRSGPQTYE